MLHEVCLGIQKRARVRFVNKVQQTDKTFLNFLEDITYKFHETQNSLKILDSTRHAMVRNYIHHNEESRVLKLLKERPHNRQAKTGVFLDEVSANLLLECFIKKRNYLAGLSVMWELCLQSYLEKEPLTPYVTALWLYTTGELIKSGVFFERVEEVGESDNEDDVDVDYRSVAYLRNPNYDGWFDIGRPRLQLGHCLLSLASSIERKLPPLLQNNLAIDLKAIAPSLRLLGFALLENANQLLTFASSKSLVVHGDVLATVEKLIKSSDRRPDNSETRRGEPVLLTESEVDSTLEKFKAIVSTITPLKKSFYTALASLVTSITTDTSIQKAEVERVMRLYDTFEVTRATVWQKEAESLRRRGVLETVKSRLRGLADEEERLTFFEHADTIEHQAWLAPRTRSERRWSRLKEWKKDLREYQEKQQGSRDAAADKGREGGSSNNLSHLRHPLYQSSSAGDTLGTVACTCRRYSRQDHGSS
ncbi:28S ribosomal protein S27 [Echinococcus granulosus]|uniref:28S ribosomal protein S27 n=1 Tax=Echinococcus granulosus TaxID=6210 RepID=W6V5P5_ECHGR|nr:28S ribosomal protein S27 [Echinococcus granulosus]EUB61659.1 28S ribosomal protein S27 [Echinococcus granulosus]